MDPGPAQVVRDRGMWSGRVGGEARVEDICFVAIVAVVRFARLGTRRTFGGSGPGREDILIAALRIEEEQGGGGVSW